MWIRAIEKLTRKITYYLLVVMILLVGRSLAQGDEIIPSYTYHGADGNRYVEGTGTFPAVSIHEVYMLDGVVAEWIVGVVTNDDTMRWLFASADGLYGELSVEFSTDTVEFAVIDVINYSGILSYPNLDLDDISDLSHPVFVGERALYIADNGDVVILQADGDVERLEVNAALDGRLAVNDAGLVAVFVDATDERYVHGIMGDDLEPSALVVIDPDSAEVVARIDLPESEIFEAMTPLWADIDDDGSQDLVTTVSTSTEGAGIRVYSLDSDIIAESDFIGQGNRWRHLLAYAPFGANGEMNLVDVVTPHIGGTVEFLAYDDGKLNAVGELFGYTSHVINTRNLDMAIAGDFNGDSITELAIPDQDRRSINGIQRDENGDVEVIWQMPLSEGQVSSNLAAVTLTDGTLALAVASDAGYITVVLPE